jgi:UDP-N-acetylglucosamine 2-epimerase (non-hydrolysing)
MKTVAVIAGARPNFMKVAPILRALERRNGLATCLIHTGQHYDANLSDVFFDELKIKRPDISLPSGGTTHAEQTARILEQTERVFRAGPAPGQKFAAVVVVGDVNSTLAAAFAAAKLCIPVAHVEAGLRSGDRSMPEEINRLATDAICDLLLASEPEALVNLQREGHPESRVKLVGNVMIDTLLHNLPAARALNTLGEYGVQPQQYATLTLHRPSNVDDPATLAGLVDVLREASQRLPIIFPVHPRTRQRLQAAGLTDRLTVGASVQVTEPLGYLPMLCLNSQARVVITDSGGLQEETTALGVPCLTMRDNTERPVTVTEGTSTLVGSDPAKLRTMLQSVLDGSYKTGRCPALWDGCAAERIADALEQLVA